MEAPPLQALLSERAQLIARLHIVRKAIKEALGVKYMPANKLKMVNRVYSRRKRDMTDSLATAEADVAELRQQLIERGMPVQARESADRPMCEAPPESLHEALREDFTRHALLRHRAAMLDWLEGERHSLITCLGKTPKVNCAAIAELF